MAGSLSLVAGPLVASLALFGGMRSTRPAPPAEILALAAAARGPDRPALRAAFAAAATACGGAAPDPACAPAGLAGRAIASFGMGKEPETEIRLWKGAAAFAQTRGEDATDCYLGLARLEGYRGRLTEAESAYRRALAVARKERGGDHASIPVILQETGLLVALAERWSAAERYLREALDALGTEAASPLAAGILQDLAGVLASQRRLTEAEVLAGRAVAMRQRVADDDREGLAGALAVHGRILRDLGRMGEAEATFAASLDCLEREFGEDHPLLLDPMLELAAAEAAAGRPDQAEDRFKAAVALEGRVGEGSDRARTAYAAFLSERGARGAGGSPRQ